MNFKLSFKEPTFYVNENKKTVTCVMTVYPGIKGDYKMENILNLIAREYLNPADYDAFKYSFSTVATAKLDPQDTFDIEVGKKVARTKAESAAYAYYARLVDRTIYGQFMDNLDVITEEFFDKADSVIEHNNEYLDKF